MSKLFERDGTFIWELMTCDIISEFWWCNLIHFEALKSYFVENRWTAPNSKLLRPTWRWWASFLFDVRCDLDVTLAELVNHGTK